jgi:hypothetical protein
MSTATFTISNIGDNPVTITGITFNTPSGISHVADLTNLGGSTAFTGSVATLSYNLNYPNSQTFTVNHTTNTGVLTASTLASTIVINGSSGTSATITVTDIVTTSTDLVSPTTSTFYSYTVPGTYYLVPPYRYATATIIGAGGGGGGNDGGGDNWAGGGGGSGAYTVSYLDLNNISGSLEIVVGAGGLPASVSFNGYPFPGIEGKTRTGTKAGGTGGDSFVFWSTSGYYYASFSTGGGGGSGNTSDARYNITGGAGGSTSGTGQSQNGVKGEDVTRPTFERNVYRAAYGGSIAGITTGQGGNSHDWYFGTNLDIHLPQGGGDGAVFLTFSNTNPTGVTTATIVSNFGQPGSTISSFNGRSKPSYIMVKITSAGGFNLDISTLSSQAGSGISVIPSPASSQRWATEPLIGGAAVDGTGYYVRATVAPLTAWLGNAMFTGPGFATALDNSYFNAYGYGSVQGSWVTVTSATNYTNYFGKSGWRLDGTYDPSSGEDASAFCNLTIEVSNTTTGVILASGIYQCLIYANNSYA